MKRVLVITSFLIALLHFWQAFPATYFVDNAMPDDSQSGLSWLEAKKTISAAIAVSAAGDTILIKYGSYQLTRSLYFQSDRMMTSDNGLHNFWDTSLFDSSQCIIMGDSSRIFTINSNAITGATHIRGFKIMGGDATTDSIENAYGGGIYIGADADPVIENCWITENTAATIANAGGGAIAIKGTGTQPIIQYCLIDSNIASTGSTGYGGGIHLDQSAPQIYHNRITGNIASTTRAGFGGGIYCNNCQATFWENEITYNVAAFTGSIGGGRGGGIYVFSGNVNVWSNTINFNIASSARSGYGGGIYIQAPYGNIWDNDISYNIGSTREEGRGGGLNCAGDGLVVRNNTITHNTANTASTGSSDWKRGYGGGAILDGTFENNIISKNTASIYGLGQGGGIYFSGAGSNVSHNIISNNVASDSSEGWGGGGWAYNALNSNLANNVFYQNANEGSGTGLGRGSGFYYQTGGAIRMKNNVFSHHNLLSSDSTALYWGNGLDIWNNCFFENGLNYNANIISHQEILENPQFSDPVNGDFTLLYNSPCIDAGADTLDYDENTNHDMGWMVDIGSHEYTGVRVWKSIPGTGEYLFGGQVRAKVNVTSPGTLSEIDIVVHPGESHPNATASVQRWYQANSTGDGAVFDITVSYKDSELNGEIETDLKLWHWDGSFWDGPRSASDTSTIENWLTVTGETAFNDWVLSDADSSAALPVINNTVVSRSYTLYQNYPNPFNPITTIEFDLPKSTKVTLKIFNVLGEEVATLLSSDMLSGHHSEQWDARNYPSGIYYYQIQAGDFQEAKKMILMK